MRASLLLLLSFVLGVAVTFFALRPERPWDAASEAPAASAPGWSQGRASVGTADALREGGHLLYFRHAQRQKWDSVIAFDVFELATRAEASRLPWRDAVCLTPQGLEEARMIGEILKLGGAPVGRVVSSPSCRARQTAQLAFGRIDELGDGLSHTPLTNVDTAAAFRADLERVLRATEIAPGTNTAILAHGNTLENHRDLFASGAEHLDRLLETGFYVISRETDGTLHVRHAYDSLGDYAAAAVPLAPGGG